MAIGRSPSWLTYCASGLEIPQRSRATLINNSQIEEASDPLAATATSA